MNEECEKKCLEKLWPPIEFWQAILHVRNVAFVIRQDEYFSDRGLPPIGSFRHSLDIVDCYLHRVELDGWFDINGIEK